MPMNTATVRPPITARVQAAAWALGLLKVGTPLLTAPHGEGRTPGGEGTPTRPRRGTRGVACAARIGGPERVHLGGTSPDEGEIDPLRSDTLVRAAG